MGLRKMASMEASDRSCRNMVDITKSKLPVRRGEIGGVGPAGSGRCRLQCAGAGRGVAVAPACHVDPGHLGVGEGAGHGQQVVGGWSCPIEDPLGLEIGEGLPDPARSGFRCRRCTRRRGPPPSRGCRSRSSQGPRRRREQLGVVAARHASGGPPPRRSAGSAAPGRATAGPLARALRPSRERLGLADGGPAAACCRCSMVIRLSADQVWNTGSAIRALRASWRSWGLRPCLGFERGSTRFSQWDSTSGTTLVCRCRCICAWKLNARSRRG
jgi:hypothetical protein